MAIWRRRAIETFPTERADRWSRDIGIEFHEVLIESNAIDIRLVFSDLIVTKLTDHVEDVASERVPEWAIRYWMPAYRG